MQLPSLDELLRERALRRAELEAAGAYFVREISDESAEWFARSLLVMAVQRDGRADLPITIYVNSTGGSVSAGYAMMEMVYHVKRVHGVTVNMHVTGAAYSMGAVLVQAGDHRSMGTLSTMMVHSSFWVLSGDDARIFRDFQKLAEHYRDVTSEIFAQRSGKHSPRWWRRFIYSGRDRFLSAQECLAYGLVDEVTTRPEAPPLGAVRPPRR
jgi:ATP-dependent Clp protease protease subunit